jgi:hypothetical protein
MYESNIEDLGHELHKFRRILERKIQSGMQRPSSVVELALFNEPYKEVFFELFKLCKRAVSNPVSTASEFFCIKAGENFSGPQCQIKQFRCRVKEGKGLESR